MKTGKPEDLLGFLKPGMRVYFQGGPGECTVLIDLLKANPEAAKGVELWSCLIPGINTFDYGSLPGDVRLVTFMASPALEPSIRSGRTQLRAMPYSEIGALLTQERFDLAILHTAPPNRSAWCGFGICCDVPQIVHPRAKQVVAFLNQRMPDIGPADGLSEKNIDLGIAIDAPLLAPAPSGPRSAALESIGRHAISLVPDGAVIQSGIGEAPAAVVAALNDHKKLRVHSGIVTPEYRILADAGALDGSIHTAGIAWGEPAFYDWLAASGLFRFRSVATTHDRKAASRMRSFISIGSAIEVDLEGNINLEWLGQRRVSSVGGAPDYVHAAAASPGGRSIIALPATAGAGASRIVRRLEANAVSIPGSLADAIVTEHGIAQLRGLSPEARARAMSEIAAPQHRAALAS